MTEQKQRDYIAKEIYQVLKEESRSITLQVMELRAKQAGIEVALDIVERFLPKQEVKS